MRLLGRVALGAATLVSWITPRPTRSPAEREVLGRAAAAVDRELAANVELVTMYLQTKQPAVLENNAYQAWRTEIAAADADLAVRLDVLYERLPDAETAMERRGPAGSIRPEDRATVELWEGNARVAQRAVRGLPSSRPPSAGDQLVAWVRARF